MNLQETAAVILATPTRLNRPKSRSTAKLEVRVRCTNPQTLSRSGYLSRAARACGLLTWCFGACYLRLTTLSLCSWANTGTRRFGKWWEESLPVTTTMTTQPSTKKMSFSRASSIFLAMFPSKKQVPARKHLTPEAQAHSTMATLKRSSLMQGSCALTSRWCGHCHLTWLSILSS